MITPGSNVHPYFCSKHLLKGEAEAALYCAHRATVIHLIDPSKLAWLSS
jgi:hypothetical protein